MWKNYTKLSMCRSKNLNISLDFANTLMVPCHMHLQGSLQICEPLETFNTVLTCASNHLQNILHASPPSPHALSYIHAACISALLNYTHIMQNIHQTFKHIQLFIWAFIQHFIHITPRLWKFIWQKIMHRHMLQYSSAPIDLAFCSQPLMFSIISGQSPRTASPHLYSLKSIGAWFSFNFFFVIYILFLSPFAFLFFSFYLFYVSCFRSLWSCS